MPELSVRIYSHNFSVTQLTPRGRAVVESFAKRYVQYGFKRGRNGQAPMLKIFATATQDRNEYRFHTHQLKDFKDHVARNYIPESGIEYIQMPVPLPRAVELVVKDSWKTKDYQESVIEYGVADDYFQKLIEIQTGKGKAQKLDSAIKIPGGWTAMGFIEEGDDVIAWDGTTTKVTGVYPQGVVPIYRVTFWDGRHAEVCGEHLWKSFYVNTTENQRWKVRNTLELKRLIEMPNPRVYVPLIEPEDGRALELPLDPYTLGVILGDGSTMAGITVSKLDEFIFDKLEAAFPEGLSWSIRDDVTRAIVGPGRAGSHPYINALKELDLMGKQAWRKFIPEQYLLAPSKEQRLALLQGLMDTDGTVNTRDTGGAVSFCSTSLELAEGVQYLVRSLGGIASLSRRQTKYTYKGEKKHSRVAWEVNIRHPRPSELFTLPRKKERTNDDNQYAKSLKLRVRSVEYVGDHEAQCISVAHESRLYVTDGFTVTHNTYCALKIASILGVRMVIIVKAQFMEKMIDDVHKTYADFEVEDLMVVRGSNQLMALIALAKLGQLESKIVLISNKTMQNWIKLYEAYRGETFGLGYETTPEDFFEVLESGLRLIDEVHMDFHLNYKIDLYTNIKKSLSLSATLISDDPFVQGMYEMTYPPNKRFSGLPYHRYVTSLAIFYSLRDPNNAKVKDPSTGNYSHNYFERWILTQRELSANYLEMHAQVMDQLYLGDDYVKGDRCGFFCASIDFASVLTDFLKKRYPHLTVARYVEDDPYENLLEPDVRVTTMGSGGTGHDIAMLTTMIMSVCMKTSSGNIQGFGRLREIPGRTVRFGYITGLDIPKQIEYHEQKDALLETRALVKGTLSIPAPL